MKIPQIDLDEIAERNAISKEEVMATIRFAVKGMTSLTKQFHIIETGKYRWYQITRRGVGMLKTQYGLFWQFDFFVNDDWEKYSVLVKGDLDEDFNPIFSDKSKIALRVDSGCETGQKFKDMTCDCNDQLMLVMQEIEKIGEGIIINIPNQEAVAIIWNAIRK